MVAAVYMFLGGGCRAAPVYFFSAFFFFLLFLFLYFLFLFKFAMLRYGSSAVMVPVLF